MPCSEAEPLTEPEALQLLPRLAMQPVLSDFSALVLDGSGVTGSIIEWVCTQELYIGSKLEFSHVHCKHSSLSYILPAPKQRSCRRDIGIWQTTLLGTGSLGLNFL